MKNRTEKRAKEVVGMSGDYLVRSGNQWKYMSGEKVEKVWNKKSDLFRFLDNSVPGWDE